MSDISFPPIIHSEGVAVAATEATYLAATTPNPVGNAFFITDVGITPNVNVANLRYFAPKAGIRRSVAGVKWMQISFKFPLCGSGVDGSSNVIYPPWWAILEACQWVATSSGSPIDTRVLKPVTQQVKACTLDLFFFAADSDSLRYRMRGCMGQSKLVLDLEQGNAWWEIELEGLYVRPSDETVPSPEYYDTSPPEIVNIATAQLDGNEFAIPYIDITNGVTIATGNSFSNVGLHGVAYKLARRTHVEGIIRTDMLREGSGSGEYDWWETMEAQDLKDIDITPIGSATGNTHRIQVPKLSLGAPRISDGEQIQRAEFPYVAHWNSSGDDEVVITLT